MAKFEILSTKAPEYDPSRTTGDQVEKTSLVVEWSDEPTASNLRRFEAQHPPHLYDAFHYVEGVGKLDGERTV